LLSPCGVDGEWCRVAFDESVVGSLALFDRQFFVSHGSRVTSRPSFNPCFLRTQLFFRTLPSCSHTCSHMSGHHPGTVRMAWRKRRARFESSERGSGRAAGSGAHPLWSCMDAAPGCRLQRRSSVNISMAWPGRVASATRAGRARDPWSCSPCWRPSRDAHGSRTSYSSTTKRTRKSRTATQRAAHSARHRVAVGDLPTSSVSAPQLVLESLGSGPTPPVYKQNTQLP